MIEDACEGLGSTVGGRPLGSFGDARRVRLLPEQADHDRRGRHGRHRRRRPRRDDAQPAQPGPRQRRHVAAARAARLQLPARRDVRGGRAWPSSSGSRSCGPGGRASPPRTSALSAAADWVTLPRRRTGRVGRLVRVRRPAASRDRPRRAHRPARRARRPDATVLLADPPAAVLPVDLRVRARRLPGHGAGRRVDAGAAVLEPPDRRRGAPTSPRRSPTSYAPMRAAEPRVCP